MQASLRRQYAVPARGRSASACLRRGYLGTYAASRQAADLCVPGLDRTLGAKASALEHAVSTCLRDTTRMVMGHPTLQTLSDAFDAADAVLKLVGQIARRCDRLGGAGLQMRIHVVLAGIRAGIADLELGLESIQLLPVSAPDYPEQD